jgi:hypothetical protein
MTPGLALDVARAAMLLRRAFEEREKGHDPLPDLVRSRSAIGTKDVADALEVALEAIVRLTWDEPDQIAAALWLDDELEADVDAFAAGAAEQ